MGYYVGIIHKDPDSDYGISFPDFPGCVSAGATLEELSVMAEDALRGHIELMAEGGMDIPSPSSIDAIMKNPDFADGVPALIRAPDIADKTVRVNLSFKQSDLAAIDRNAEQRGQTRSAFLADVGALN